MHVGCDGREVGVPALAFADNIALVAPTPNALQSMLTTLDEWCIAINISKTKIMHFRKKRQPCSTFNFMCSNLKIEYCSEYKYLGLWINDISMMVDRVCLATRKTLGALIAKYKDMGSLHYDTTLICITHLLLL